MVILDGGVPVLPSEWEGEELVPEGSQMPGSWIQWCEGRTIGDEASHSHSELRGNAGPQQLEDGQWVVNDDEYRGIGAVEQDEGPPVQDFW